MEDILQEITVFADQAHGQQTRKYTPERYIVHPVRVMKICREYTDDITVLAAALLHDVLEDTPVRKEQILDFLLSQMAPEQALKTIRLVEELTDVYVKRKYPHWNRRKRKNREAERLAKVSAEAQTIKYADIMDNSLEVVNHDPVFGKLYLREGIAILQKMTQGDQRLYRRALTTVEDCLAQVSHPTS